ncbi:MAG: molybdopterin-dependent oxidoreductase, partial [Chloroflexota bacterium]
MAAEHITLNIDGQTVTAPKGATVLEAAKAAGIYIPTLCYHPALEPYGGCRMCIVEIEKMRGLPPACTTPAAPDMVVHTKTPQLEELRKQILEMVYTEHPHSCLLCWKKERCHNFEVCQRTPSVTKHCIYCPKNYQCELQEVSDYVDMKHRPLTLSYHYRGMPLQNEDPFIVRDFNLCILCGRCVRVCQDVRVNGCLAFTYRGSQAIVGTAFGRPYKESGSEFCGACVDICPVGAIMERNFNYQGSPDKKINTTCPYCAVGCQLILEVKDNRVMRSAPNPDGPTNHGQACVKGRFGLVEVVHHPERLTTPLVRREGKLVPATWEEALNEAARGLSQFKPDEVAVFGAGKCTNEDNYVIQKLARAVLGTNNIDHCARLCHAPTVTGLMESFGSGAMTNTIADIAHSQTIFAIGCNTTAAHPIIGLQVIKATQNGKKLIVANPRQIELARYADIFIQHRPGS